MSIITANSSWVWLTDGRPIDSLYYAIFLTVGLEFLIILTVNRIKKPLKLLAVVGLANPASFGLPYIYLPYFIGIGYSQRELIEKGPVYTIGTGYLLLTLAVEIPTVYYCFYRACDRRKLLLFSIIIANIITTLAVAII